MSEACQSGLQRMQRAISVPVVVTGIGLLFAMLCCPPARCETIELANGTSMTGTLIRSDGTDFTFIVDNKTVTKKREEIAAIAFLPSRSTPAGAEKPGMKVAATTAVEALEVLVSITKRGVNCADYRTGAGAAVRAEYKKRVADATIALDKFTNQWGKNNVIAQGLSAAMLGYDDLANTTWENATGGLVPPAFFESLFKICPELKDELLPLTGYGPSLHVNLALRAIWDWSAELVKATRSKLSDLK